MTLYLVLDEAHRGLGKPTAAAENSKSTIVQRLINGSGSLPGIPIVWGISATVERFNQAIEFAGKHIKLPNVVVDAAKVQESGLIKDTILLDIPDETGNFDTVLVRRATDKLKASTLAWTEYAKQQEEASLVVPLLVLQVPNTPDPNEIGPYFDAQADELAKTFLTTYSAQIKGLIDERKESYRQIIEMSADPQSVDLVKPESRYEATQAIEHGNLSAFPTWKSHLLCDQDGNYPADSISSSKGHRAGVD